MPNLIGWISDYEVLNDNISVVLIRFGNGDRVHLAVYDNTLVVNQILARGGSCPPHIYNNEIYKLLKYQIMTAYDTRNLVHVNVQDINNRPSIIISIANDRDVCSN